MQAVGKAVHAINLSMCKLIQIFCRSRGFCFIHKATGIDHRVYVDDGVSSGIGSKIGSLTGLRPSETRLIITDQPRLFFCRGYKNQSNAVIITHRHPALTSLSSSPINFTGIDGDPETSFSLFYVSHLFVSFFVFSAHGSTIQKYLTV